MSIDNDDHQTDPSTDDDKDFGEFLRANSERFEEIAGDDTTAGRLVKRLLEDAERGEL